ncbi:MAG: hypothetical protein Greene041619_768 [Candidatus Peregrinibacteria bacterium Greene0416_19]|nr:MAG: hypothetical protein Greene041619_768 [Candidatus Peregrinibacteria bacterium Greene0416_19]
MLIMFALDPIHPLYTSVLTIVSVTPGITVAELHARMRKAGHDVTLQHLYRIVNRLTDEQILVKTGTHVAVNLMWLSYLQFFAERGKGNLQKLSVHERIFPMKEGQRRTFKVDTLADLQTLWNHLLVQLHGVAPQKHLLKYYSHAWWQLGKHALTAEFYRRITQEGVRCYWLFGNDTFLDQYAARMHREVMDTRLTSDPPFPREGYNLNVYGAYMFECLLPERLTRQLAFVFSSVSSIDQFDVSVFDDIFTLRDQITLKVTCSEKQARLLRLKIERFFLKPA